MSISVVVLTSVWRSFVCDVIVTSVYAENTLQRGKYHSMADLLFDGFGFDQSSKSVFQSTSTAKKLNPNKKQGVPP